MKTTSYSKIFTLLILTNCLTFCGDNSDSDDSDDSSSSVSSSTGSGSDDSSEVIPTLNFTTPDISTSLALAADSVTIVERWVDRADKVVDQINNIIGRLNSEIEEDASSFSGKGPNGNISGVIADNSSDEAYEKEALICSQGSAFLYVAWNTEGTEVKFIRDFSVNPMSEDLERALMAEVVYSSVEDVQVDFTVQGTPWYQPDNVTEGPELSEFVSIKQVSGEGTLVKGVNNWYSTFPESPEADAYMTGSLQDDGSGEFVAYRKFNTDECSAAFDPEADSPAWCLGREVGSSDTFDSDQILAAWENLKDYGIADLNNLTTVSLPEHLSCPE
jgi:hypothetical protein